MSNVQITVLYPNTSDATFNMDYYLKTHMPMVAEEFGPYNFEGYSVLKLVGTPDPDQAAPHSVQATLHFKSLEDFQKAVTDRAAKVLGDVPNFSNKDPVLMIGQKMA
jgi:uncharacterized protein (TIGR02118 family)